MDAGTAPDSPAADPVVADVVAAWLPSHADTRPGLDADRVVARGHLAGQLTATPNRPRHGSGDRCACRAAVPFRRASPQQETGW
jgi:hypothetical protein